MVKIRVYSAVKDFDNADEFFNYIRRDIGVGECLKVEVVDDS